MDIFLDLNRDRELLLKYQKFCLKGAGMARHYEQTMRGSSLDR